MENPPTGAVCFNDVVALGLMVGLERSNVKPGRDFAVTGIDDVEEAAVSYPALTTVSTSPRLVGELAADLLLRRIVTPTLPTERIILPTKLIVRGSSGD
jgi:LacI family transcriptional regulator